MRIGVSISGTQVRRAMDKTSRVLTNPHRMIEAIARGFRDHVRKTINSRDGGNWAPASKWTRAKKRTNRPLAGQAQNIQSVLVGAEGRVFYSGVSQTTGKSISITEHHFGKVLPADRRLVRLSIRNPAPLKLSPGATQIWFRWVKNSVVPARKIWPDRPGEAQAIAEPLASKWLAQAVQRNWK